jgi:tRNA G46 methylase TrmB
MYANSSTIRSMQRAPHPRLREVVLKHLREPYRRVPSDAGREAFASVADRLAERPFILDAGCGNGASTFEIARRHPEAIVIGVDKSAARLAAGLKQMGGRGGAAPPNAMLLRCELVDFWQLCAAANLRCERQYLLYPNPWPKTEQLKRRWHAHPVLPSILALGGSIELRTNWRIYAEEFAAAMQLAGARIECCAAFAADEAALTPFERKYVASGHSVWRCVVTAPQRST